ncbi:MAG TPA: FGGY family carbohydrate kinase [Acidimicrobiales bacterium]|nr:FGGY family carbohydrate kinase [Acidimicrobiales bacterium]
MILTIDLGTSVTKAALWRDDGLAAVGRAPLECQYGPGNRVEQDPGSWWPSVVAACEAARAGAGGRGRGRGRGRGDAVRALGFSAARQTFVPVSAAGVPLGTAMVWSDRRAGAEAAALAASCGGASPVREQTGVVLDAASVAAKVAWLERHEPERLRQARWLLSPRDLLAWRLTGEVCTDRTLASATGMYDDTGRAVPALVGDSGDRLPAVHPSDSVVGALLAGPAAELALPPGIPVVIGAGDRACEVLGAGASAERPMVSWGTTANVSVPAAHRPHPAPDAMIVTRGALGGWLLEGGLSAAGSLVAWLARLTGLDADTLLARAAVSPPGARGVVALPWFGGARAPWWRDGARGALTGLSHDHDAGDLARAVVESVAWDVARCLGSAHGSFEGLVLGGAGAAAAVWVDVLTAVTGLAASRRLSGEAASAGAAMVVARAVGSPLDLDRFDPVVAETHPDESWAERYRALRPRVDEAATAIIGIGARDGDGAGAGAGGGDGAGGGEVGP